MRSVLFFSLLFVLLPGVAVGAQPMRDQEIREYLGEYLKVQGGYEGNATEAGMFLGYVRGVLDALEGTALCIPDNASMESLIQRVVRYIHSHPHSPRGDSRMLVFGALRDQYPCGH